MPIRAARNTSNIKLETQSFGLRSAAAIGFLKHVFGLVFSHRDWVGRLGVLHLMATKRMLIDASHPEETRVLIVNKNKLEDFDVEFEARRPLKGNIYLAKVTRVESRHFRRHLLILEETGTDFSL